jgi:ABC-type transport system involved in multi-copper enzyme maturation permease subunit
MTFARVVPHLQWGRVATLVHRELRDQLRDWRVVIPVVILTGIFPLLMNFAAQTAMDFVSRYGAPIIAEQLFPFLLMIVGFFPTTVSLVIALESFVGEKERYSLEPLLSTPLSDEELFVGKALASMATPLASAALGIRVYLTGL